MNYVITIGREFGSGGHEVGSRLAKRLGIPFYDKEILSLTAENSRFAESYLQKVDEKRPVFLGGGASFLSGAAFGSAGEAMMSQFYHLSVNDQVFLEQSKVMHELAKKGSCVIVGRGSDYVLRDEKSINIFICADLKDRVKRKLSLAENSGLTEEQVEKIIVNTDKTRAKFYEYYTHESWGDSRHYDLCVNTSSVGIDGAVDVIADFIKTYHTKSILPDK